MADIFKYLVSIHNILCELYALQKHALYQTIGQT